MRHRDIIRDTLTAAPSANTERGSAGVPVSTSTNTLRQRMPSIRTYTSPTTSAPCASTSWHVAIASRQPRGAPTALASSTTS